MAFKSEKVDRDWDAAKGGKSRERLEGRQHRSPPKAQEFSKWISAVSPSRKRHHQPHQRHGQRAAPRKVRTLDISKPSNFVHKSSSSGSQKRLLAEQLAAAEVAIQDPPSVDDYETSLPSYTAAMKRTKPAPLDIRAAVSAGKAMVKHSEQRRQEAQEKQKTIPPATHTRTASRREDVPKALQPRIRSLRRKPIPLVPLPKAPGEDAATPLSQTHDSPVDKPLQKLRESKSSMLRPDSGSTFFCQGSALLVGDKLSKFKGKNDSKIPEETKQEDIKRLTVTHVDPRMSMMSIATTGPSGAKAPPNSMAVGDTDEVEKRKSARAVMAEKYQGQIEQ